MNKAKLKTYAPQARKDFIAAVTTRAHRLGLSDNNGQLQITPAEKNGDLVIIAGQSWPAKISRQRDNLIGLMHKHGFAQTVENVAYRNGHSQQSVRRLLSVLLHPFPKRSKPFIPKPPFSFASFIWCEMA